MGDDVRDHPPCSRWLRDDECAIFCDLDDAVAFGIESFIMHCCESTGGEPMFAQPPSLLYAASRQSVKLPPVSLVSTSSSQNPVSRSYL